MRLGKYMLERRLGGGGMAELFLGHATKIEGFSRPALLAERFVGRAPAPSRRRRPQ
ncbi:MAG: hypothetical protein WKG01_14265 [Kofleriaceae bacterium]